MARRMIRELPESEQPYNRLANFGEEALSDAELLSLFLWLPDGLDVAYELLSNHGSLNGMMRASVDEIQKIAGIGGKGALRLRALLELARRISQTRPKTKRIDCPAAAAEILMPLLRYLEREELWVLSVDTKRNVMGIDQVYKGTVNTSCIRLTEVFKKAVERKAVGIIVAHNHPSGDPNPSPEDMDATRKMIKAGELLDVDVLDHLVIGDGRFISIRERLGSGWAR